MSPLEPTIGATLRDTRIRRKIDLTKVESETKIRIRYLRALENEEWDVLPGGAYTRGFIRTYASFLGLDGERLADEYRREFEQTVAERPSRHDPVPTPRPPRGGGGGGLSKRALAGLVSVGLIVILVAIGLLGGGSDGTAPAPVAKKRDGGRRNPGRRQQVESRGVTVKLAAQADVWVCLLNAAGTRLIGGRVLSAGAEEGPFRSGRFTVAFGNGSVAMQVDGKQVPLTNTPNPIGYEIAPSGRVRPLAGGRRPTCE
jgi:cytoskeleton protein RodZ